MASTTQLAWLGIGAGIMFAYLVKLRKSSKVPKTRASSGRLCWKELIDARNRADHPTFNRRLLDDFEDLDAIEVEYEDEDQPIFVVHKYDSVVKVISDPGTFTSNPWPATRSVVTLNTTDKANHDRIYRILRPFYTPAAIGSLSESIRHIFEEHGVAFRQDGDVFKFSKRVHMHISLVSSGLAPAVGRNSELIDRFIYLNDTAVRLVAPLGGIGRRPTRSFKACWKMLMGLCRSLPATVALVRRIGISQVLDLLSPLEVLWPSFPYTQVWEFPELLHCMPEYFVELYDLMQAADAETAAGSLYSAIGTSLSPAEALGTAVQLMVNMTAANQIMSLVMRKCTDYSVSIESVLLTDPALQRNPRRALKDTRIGSVFVPKNSLVLLMIGAANLDRPEGSTAMTFGFGLHHCLGRHLMHLELEECSRWLNDNCSTQGMSLFEEPQRLTDVDVGNWGFSHLRVVFQ